ncbi:Uncharacterised protein [Vibrio cholerae]|nr:Uncharacterised protein [Vibrio cholerae]
MTPSTWKLVTERALSISQSLASTLPVAIVSSAIDL